MTGRPAKEGRLASRGARKQAGEPSSYGTSHAAAAAAAAAAAGEPDEEELGSLCSLAEAELNGVSATSRLTNPSAPPLPVDPRTQLYGSGLLFQVTLAAAAAALGTGGSTGPC
jgi:hypothetical protein